MAVNTTFSMMQQLLKDAVDAYASLTDVLKTALKARVDALPKTEHHVFGSSNVEASTGVTVDEANDAITVPNGSSGTVDWDGITFATPVRIAGTDGENGALIGHTGQGSNPAVDVADITLKYRTTSGGSWLAFSRTVVVDETSYFQLRAEIAVQGADADLPQLHILPEQL